MNVLIAGDFAPMARLEKKIVAREFNEVFPDDLCAVIPRIFQL